ncbi:hypothetical protein ABZ554_37395, partial [Streptomyces sp. NPDC020125]
GPGTPGGGGGGLDGRTPVSHIWGGVWPVDGVDGGLGGAAGGTEGTGGFRTGGLRGEPEPPWPGSWDV